MELLLILSCLNAKGCEDTAHAYYLSNPQIETRAEYFKQAAEERLGKATVVASTSSLLFISGYQWTYKLTDGILLKGEKQWEKLSLSYQYCF